MLLTGLARSAGPTPVPPDTSRYLVLGAIVVLLIAVEVARGMRPPRVATVAMVGLTVVAVIAGLHALDAGADELRGHSRTVEAHLAATALLGASVPADAHPSPAVAPQVRAGDYLAVVAAFGESPIGDPDAALAALEPDERARADEVLSQYGLTMVPALWPVAGCQPVTGDSVAVPDGGAVTIDAHVARRGASPLVRRHVRRAAGHGVAARCDAHRVERTARPCLARPPHVVGTIRGLRQGRSLVGLRGFEPPTF